MKRLLAIFAATLCFGLFLLLNFYPPLASSGGIAPEPPPTLTPPRTEAVTLTGEGIENFHQVSNELYRGAQPTAAGMLTLKNLGVKTVINLRLSSSDRSLIGETGLAYEHIYFNPLNPAEKEVVRFLQIVTDASRQPVFVHCRHGSDRTGMLVAVYRIFVQGWSKEEAIQEMTTGDFGFHDYFDKPIIGESLTDFLRQLDVPAIKKRAKMMRE